MRLADLAGLVMVVLAALGLVSASVWATVGDPTDTKRTRLESRHTEIYTLSLHDALPISVNNNATGGSGGTGYGGAGGTGVGIGVGVGYGGGSNRYEEDTSGVQAHRDLHSFPTRRSSDLGEQQCDWRIWRDWLWWCWRHWCWYRRRCGLRWRIQQIRRGHVWSPGTPRSTLFPYTTLFRSR